MTCLEAESMVIPYIHGELDDRCLESFLNHIESCPNCKDELETYYIVETGIKQLDSDSVDFDIKGSLERAIIQSRKRLHVIKTMLITKYAVSTLAVMGVTVAILLQIRIWIQTGFI